MCELVWVLESGHGFSRPEIAGALERILAIAQFEIEGKDLARAALDDFRGSAADFSDCLLDRRNRAAGASETPTFDQSLRGLTGVPRPLKLSLRFAPRARRSRDSGRPGGGEAPP